MLGRETPVSDGAELGPKDAIEEARQRLRTSAQEFAQLHPSAWAQAEAELAADPELAESRESVQLAHLVKRTSEIEAAQAENAAAAKLKELTTGESSVLDKSREAATKKVSPRFEYPEPDTEAEMTAIQQRSSQLRHVMQAVGDLGLEGVDVQVQIAGLHEIGSRCEQLARDIGMHAVSERRMTQVQLSRLIGVHELTVHRWVKALQQEQHKQEDGQKAAQ